MALHFLTGGTGLVGRALLRDLLDEGHEVMALVRTVADAPGLTAMGADPVVGDLTEPEAWCERAARAEVVWHAGLPRLEPPLRPSGARRNARRASRGAEALAAAAGDRPVVVASSVLVSGRGPAADPIGMARAQHAAETVLAGPATRAVRLGWVYGTDSVISAIVSGLRGSRFRIVGDGTNRMPLVSADDAAAALRAALQAPPGTYTAAEPDIPTQKELVHAICVATGALRPDHLPPRVAALSFGGALVEALTTSVEPAPGALDALGWAPSNDWRRDLVSLAVRSGAWGRA